MSRIVFGRLSSILNQFNYIVGHWITIIWITLKFGIFSSPSPPPCMMYFHFVKKNFHEKVMKWPTGKGLAPRVLENLKKFCLVSLENQSLFPRSFLSIILLILCFLVLWISAIDIVWQHSTLHADTIFSCPQVVFKCSLELVNFFRRPSRQCLGFL